MSIPEIPVQIFIITVGILLSFLTFMVTSMHFSDIHGDLDALPAVLAEIYRNEVDKIICLGNASTHFPQPVEDLATLKSSTSEFIMRNHDHFLPDPKALRDYATSDCGIEKH